jgi:hypothetical protein
MPERAFILYFLYSFQLGRGSIIGVGEWMDVMGLVG